MKSDFQIIQGDCRTELAKLPEKSCHMCVTSPPYHGLRKYEGVEPSVWGSLDDFALPRKHPERWLIRIKWRAAERGGVFSRNRQTWIGLLGLEPTVDCGQPMVQLRSTLTTQERAFVVKRLQEERLV